MGKVVTVVLKKDGRHHLTLDNCSPEDARRWADEGYVVFQLAVSGKSWAVHHVNDQKVMTDQTLSAGAVNPADGGGAGAIVRLLQIKGE